nr:YceD family protein [Motilibacter peucedani]
MNRTVPAPAGLGSDVIGVAQGSDLALELRLEAVMEGVLVSGTALATVTGECVRCLDPIEHELEVDVQELFAYPESSSAEAEEDEVHHLEGDLLDVEPVVRDAVVLALPLQPVCEDDCPGLCVECGARLADDPDHGHEVADPRWAALSGLLPGDEAEPAAPHQP